MKKTYIVIGLGRFGSAVAQRLYELGSEVLAIDLHPELVQKIESKVTCAAVCDARDEDALRALGVRNYDCAVVAIGGDLATSVVATLNLKELGVQTVVCKATDETQRRALEKIGLYDLTAPLWAQYFSMLDRDLTTVPERPGDTRSDCHAWSALPLYEYPRMLLGVQLDAPGWERIRVKPHALGLKELSGVVPTPKGEVRVGWHVEDNGQMHLCVQGPDVPLIIEVNGKTYYAEHGAMEF